MTVKELIEELAKYPEDSEVVIRHPNDEIIAGYDEDEPMVDKYNDNDKIIIS